MAGDELGGLNVTNEYRQPDFACRTQSNSEARLPSYSAESSESVRPIGSAKRHQKLYAGGVETFPARFVRVVVDQVKRLFEQAWNGWVP